MSPESKDAQKESEKETQQLDLSWTSDTVNMRVDVQCRTPENESSLRKAHERERRG